MLPSYQGDYRDGKDRVIPALIGRGADGPEWLPVQPGHTINPGDVLVLRIGVLPRHVGVAISSTMMLHCEPACHTVCESFRDRLWGNALVGAYRHERLLDGR